MEGLREGAMLRHATYRIERVLGQGGFGITYLAVHVLLKRKVAIKEFFPKMFCDRTSDTSRVRCATASNTQLVERLRAKFLKEARHIADMECPNIVRITDVFEENGTAYYVMDYIEGRTLAEIVKENGPLSEQKAIGYVSKIGEALSYIHSKRMNHLDVKPANIMVRSKDDMPILIDFGLSKQYDSGGDQTSTTPVGRSHGFSPIEQYNDDDSGVREFAPQTDVYSLGATLYYLLSGVVPVRATLRIEEELSFPPSIPQRLIGPISKAMSVGRKSRHAQVSDFIRELQSVTSVPPEPNVSDDTTEISERGKPSRSLLKKYKPWIIRNRIYIIGVAAMIGVAIGAWCLWPSGQGSQVDPQPIPVADTTSMAKENTEQEPEAESKPAYPWDNFKGHEGVDLGLSVKWATCNVGADSPSDYGDYFAWGETRPKSSYTWSNCFDCRDDKGKSWGVYKKGGKTHITPDSGHDTARENWGGTWRMPTDAENEELVKKCKWTWTSKNGHNGYVVTGPNGNSIFLPAAGCRDGTESYYVGSSGSYWSCTLSSDDSDARDLYFSDSYYYTSYNFRSYGQSVRPVTE